MSGMALNAPPPQGMVYVIYLYSRLRMLLYDDELKARSGCLVVFACCV